ncbi:MAG: DUF3108 domain-containing protein [Candidatus Cloacimonetes bacterium]|jgi:hypothetical protein|nr:DUF3108 domain-containing protein [Candidatus Cloacimonadota bacterium]MDD2506515.1 DUF3108 domain-containing protein [Candidatus Cloacimonadota bacterium]MDD4147405.1 DUF3108 domain-containing protein [Candidatus Cloacimonadota bacterium]MDD4559847.1 DUF3108 domain-containing protein [Candidatus Cloacimonadota bacterium]
MTSKLLLLAILLSFQHGLWGLHLKYKVTSLKLNVATIDMKLYHPEISIAVKSRIKVPLFPHLDNQYKIVHDDVYRPLQYTRIIKQSSLEDSVFTVYNKNSVQMKQKLTGKIYNYKVQADTRDVFSLLAKISSDPNSEGDYTVDGNGRLWRVRVSKGRTEKISTALGKQTARRHDFSFKALSPEKAPYIDMLTFNFLDEDTILSLWVSMNGVPLKAYLKKNMTSMSWDIMSVSK